MGPDYGFVKIKKSHKYKTALKGDMFPILRGNICFYINTPGMTFTLIDMKDQSSIFDLSNVKEEIIGL